MIVINQDIKTDRQINRQTDNQINKKAVRQIERKKDSGQTKTHRQMCKQTIKQTDR